VAGGRRHPLRPTAPPRPPGPGAPPPNYLVWAILTTIFCCLPLGVVSIVFSTQVNSKWAMGDVAGAQAASANAKKFAMWAAIVKVALAILYLIAVVALGVGSFSFNSSTN